MLLQFSASIAFTTTPARSRSNSGSSNVQTNGRDLFYLGFLFEGSFQRPALDATRVASLLQSSFSLSIGYRFVHGLTRFSFGIAGVFAVAVENGNKTTIFSNHHYSAVPYGAYGDRSIFRSISSVLLRLQLFRV